MFYECTSLTSLDLTSFDVSKVNSMRWIFAYCDKLTIITVNNNWNTSRAYNYSIGDQNGTTGMFEDCGIRSVTRV